MFVSLLKRPIFLCPEQAPACFNARGWILTTDFTAPSRTLHPKALNELHSQNRRRLYYRRPPRCKDMIRDVEDNGQGNFVALLQTLNPRGESPDYRRDSVTNITSRSVRGRSPLNYYSLALSPRARVREWVVVPALHSGK